MSNDEERWRTRRGCCVTGAGAGGGAEIGAEAGRE